MTHTTAHEARVELVLESSQPREEGAGVFAIRFHWSLVEDSAGRGGGGQDKGWWYFPAWALKAGTSLQGKKGGCVLVDLAHTKKGAEGQGQGQGQRLDGGC